MSSVDYRFYHQDPDGRIHFAEWISAASDEHAIEQIRATYPDAKCEVWSGTRLVAKLSPTGHRPDAPDVQGNIGKRPSRQSVEMRAGPDC